MLAFDPGTKNTGWAVLENINPTFLTLSIIATGKLKTTTSTIKGSNDIKKLISIYSPDFLAYEKAAEKKLNYVFNQIISNAIKTYNIPCVGYTVANIRNDIFNGKLCKNETLYALKERILLLKTQISSHELDALSVALYALEMKIMGNI